MLPEDHAEKISELKNLIDQRGVTIEEAHDWFCWGAPSLDADEKGYEIYCLFNTEVSIPFNRAMFLEHVDPEKNKGAISKVDTACATLPQDLVMFIKGRNEKLTLFREVGKIVYDKADNESKATMLSFAPNATDALIVECARTEDTETLKQIAELIKDHIKEYKVSKIDIPKNPGIPPSRTQGDNPKVSRAFVELGKNNMAFLSSVIFYKFPEEFRQDIESAFVDAPNIRRD